MPNPALRALLERAAADAGFRAKLLADPALAQGLSREQLMALLDDLAMLNGQLTDEMLDNVAGGMSRVGHKPGGPQPMCDTQNHNEAGLRIVVR